MWWIKLILNGNSFFSYFSYMNSVFEFCHFFLTAFKNVDNLCFVFITDFLLLNKQMLTQEMHLSGWCMDSVNWKGKKPAAFVFWYINTLPTSLFCNVLVLWRLFDFSYYYSAYFFNVWYGCFCFPSKNSAQRSSVVWEPLFCYCKSQS